jgi:hypothetical protein
MTLWGATRLPDIEDGTLACLRYKRSTMTPGGCMAIPRIRFSHRDGMIINQDRDDIRHASTTTASPGYAMETVIQHNPRAECDEAEARRQAEAVAQASPPINAF